MNQEILSISGFNGFNAARSALLRRFLLFSDIQVASSEESIGIAKNTMVDSANTSFPWSPPRKQHAIVLPLNNINTA